MPTSPALPTNVTSEALLAIGLPAETLDRAFKRLHSTIGSMPSVAADLDLQAFRARAEVGRDTLTIGQIYAWWLVESLAVADAQFDAELATYLASDELDSSPIYRRYDQRRNAACRRALGMTYRQMLASRGEG